MVKYISIKTGKPNLCGRSPLFMSERQSDSAKNLRYYQYQILFYHYHPNQITKQNATKQAIEQLPIMSNITLKSSKAKWFEIAPNWIVELFTRDKSNQEILSGTA